MVTITSDGWKIDVGSDYRRMGIPTPEWGITNINKDFLFCETYPSKLYIPTKITSQGEFRSLFFE
jgi:hypothetical protein